MADTIFGFTLSSDYDWQSGATCSDPDAPYMFPDPSDHVGNAMAKQWCADCPVRPDCLAHALRTNEREGVWGGMTPEERDNSRRNEMRRNRRKTAA